MRPHRWQPTRLFCPWDSPGKNTGVGCHFLLQCMKVKSESEVAQSCLTLSDPMDCSPTGSSVHGIFQARVLEWGAIAFSIMTCIHHYIMQSIVTALKVLCALPIHLSCHWSFYCLHSFDFSRTSYDCNHTVCNLFQIGFLLSNMSLWLDSSFLFSSSVSRSVVSDSLQFFAICISF